LGEAKTRCKLQVRNVHKKRRIRKPAIFLGFRTDKPATSVVPEEAVEVPTKRSAAKRGKRQTATDSNWPVIESEKITERDELQIEECQIPVTNGSRMVWRGISKVRLMQYYHDIHRYIMPHIVNRPLSLHIKPKGANAPGLYIKDMEGREPNCASVFSVPRLHRKQGKRDIIDYLVCNNEATLLYQINLGCIDINPWTSRTTLPDSPDYIVIDLDPSDEDFKKAVEAARASKSGWKEKKSKHPSKRQGKRECMYSYPVLDSTLLTQEPSLRTFAQKYMT
jgi:bifunctional non-homologous end joining protein LigD